MSWPNRHVSDAEACAILGCIAIGYTVVAGIATRVFKTWWNDEDSKMGGWFWPIVIPYQLAVKVFAFVWRLGVASPSLFKRRSKILPGARVVNWTRK